MSLHPRPLVSAESVRRPVARLLATYFLLHLREEMRKPDAVIYEVYPDLPIRDLTQTMVADIRREFAIGEDEKLPADNIFKRWCQINGKFDYEDSAFSATTRFSIPRLLDLRDGTTESRERFLSRHAVSVRALSITRSRAITVSLLP